MCWQEPGDAQAMFKLKVGRRDPIENGGTLKVNWRMTASRMGILMGGREGVNIPDEKRKPAYDELVRCYGKWDKEPPEFKAIGEPVVWKCGEPEILAEELAAEKELLETAHVLVALDYMRRNVETVRNYGLHLTRSGGGLSPDVLGATLRSIRVGAEVLRTGEVLSAANLGDAQDAVTLLQDVIARHEAAQAARKPSDGDKGQTSSLVRMRPRLSI